MGVAYVLSIRYVFKHRALTAQPRRELLVFAFIGILGLGLTQLILWVTIDRLTLPPELSKLLAAGVTFFFNYFLRKLTLFSERPSSLRRS
jgi:putative flippase GtrA